jgi:conjugal transfer pilus assembly protein TraE
MELSNRQKSVQELSSQITLLHRVIAGFALATVILAGSLFTQQKIVVLQVPGMPTDAVLEKSSLDKGSQRAVLMAVTSNLVQSNPSNYEYQKRFLQDFLAGDVYTSISLQIDSQIKKLVDQHELGSYYFTLKRYFYDAQLNKHFVVGDVHTVNAAKDTSVTYVYEYEMKIDNYRPVITSILSYKGDAIHDHVYYDSLKK